MKVGFIGMGKLGLPVAVAINANGHDVVGYDINPNVYKYMSERDIPFKEESLQPLLDKHTVNMVQTVNEVVGSSEIIFLPVQTPHAPEYEGSTRIPKTRADFNYQYLVNAVTDVVEQANKQKKAITLVVISTCLPGTYERLIKPIVDDSEYVNYVYNPFFIAMGTVLQDFLDPEFVLIGQEDKEATKKLKWLYESLHDKPLLFTDITTAEGIKVSYNTWITMKTVVANAWGELAYKTNMNFDDIYKAWTLATDRLISPKYMKAGMSDGGGCHPRDNIAMSYIADKVGMSHNIFEDLMAARESYEEWHAREAVQTAISCNLPLILLGRSFKPETNIETGSPAILVSNIIEEMEYPFTHVEDLDDLKPAVYFIATQHERYEDYEFPKDSVVIDPFRYIPDQEGVSVVRIGQKVV